MWQGRGILSALAPRQSACARAGNWPLCLMNFVAQLSPQPGRARRAPPPQSPKVLLGGWGRFSIPWRRGNISLNASISLITKCSCVINFKNHRPKHHHSRKSRPSHSTPSFPNAPIGNPVPPFVRSTTNLVGAARNKQTGFPLKSCWNDGISDYCSQN